MLNPALNGKYQITSKVVSPEWRHATLGVVTLATISEAMADKLVKKGYLVKVVEPDKPFVKVWKKKKE
jgi:hypothetical protein